LCGKAVKGVASCLVVIRTQKALFGVFAGHALGERGCHEDSTRASFAFVLRSPRVKTPVKLPWRERPPRKYALGPGGPFWLFDTLELCDGEVSVWDPSEWRFEAPAGADKSFFFGEKRAQISELEFWKVV
jgi:hypothetical protein